MWNLLRVVNHVTDCFQWKHPLSCIFLDPCRPVFRSSLDRSDNDEMNHLCSRRKCACAPEHQDSLQLKSCCRSFSHEVLLDGQAPLISCLDLSDPNSKIALSTWKCSQHEQRLLCIIISAPSRHLYKLTGCHGSGLSGYIVWMGLPQKRFDLWLCAPIVFRYLTV